MRMDRLALPSGVSPDDPMKERAEEGARNAVRAQNITTIIASFNMDGVYNDASLL